MNRLLLLLLWWLLRNLGKSEVEGAEEEKVVKKWNGSDVWRYNERNCINQTRAKPVFSYLSLTLTKQQSLLRLFL